MSISEKDSELGQNTNYVSHGSRTGSDQNYGLERSVNAFDASRTTANATSFYQTSAVGASSTSDVVYTRSTAETERYLDNLGITLCKSPNVIRRTEIGKSSEYEQRVCLRYLQPPALPRPGPLIIEEIRRPGPPGPTLIIHEQPIPVDALAPLVLRERPPTPPVIPGPETRTEYTTSDSPQGRSVIIERHPPDHERPRDIVIERWLPYGPLPEREVIRKTSGGEGGSKATCTIINYETSHSHVNRKFAVVDVYNADPKDYMIRYRESVLDPIELVEQVRRMGVNEDISSPSAIVTSTRADRKSVDYLQSRNGFCDCFSVGVTATGVDLEYSKRSRYNDYSTLAEASSTTKYERRRIN